MIVKLRCLMAMLQLRVERRYNLRLRMEKLRMKRSPSTTRKLHSLTTFPVKLWKGVKVK